MSPFVHVAWPTAAADLLGFASITQSTTELSSDFRFGWEFTVGASAITATHLRVFVRSTNTQRVRIHRISDGVLMATADITAVSGAWVEASITPVALAASTSYVVSNRRVSSSAELHARTPDSVTYATQLSYVGGRYGYVDSGDGMPGTTSSAVYSNCDFRFTV